MYRKIFITGTDTDVGKTVFSLLAMNYFNSIGFSPFYLKPFQTGCTDHSQGDAAFIYEYHLPFRGKDPTYSTISMFKAPKAPYFAARNENKIISPLEIVKKTDEICSKHTISIIEGAGGLYVPLTKKVQTIDFIKSIQPEVVVVARGGLGTINHTTLTINTLKAHDLRILGVVFMDISNSNPLLITENMEAVEMATGVKVHGVIKKINSFQQIEPKHYKITKSLFAKT